MSATACQCKCKGVSSYSFLMAFFCILWFVSNGVNRLEERLILMNNMMTNLYVRMPRRAEPESVAPEASSR